MDVVALPLSRGAQTIVDAADAAGLVGTKWSLHGTKTGRYASRWTRSGMVLLHRVLMAAPKGVQVDHINGDGLDNRRSNLRLATSRQNLVNRPSWGKSGYRGVSLHDCGRWRAECDGRYLGLYDTAEEAAAAYAVAAIEAYGDFAYVGRKEEASSWL